MIERKDYTQALTYLRSALAVAAQQASAHSGAVEGDVDRLHGEQPFSSPDALGILAHRWTSWLPGARETIAITRWLGGILGFSVWAYLWFITPDIGLTPAATKQLGILLLTFICWVFWVFPDYGVALMFALGFIVSGSGTPETVLGGFASTTWFMTLGVLGLGDYQHGAILSFLVATGALFST
jgi:hypothetical protein